MMYHVVVFFFTFLLLFSTTVGGCRACARVASVVAAAAPDFGVGVIQNVVGLSPRLGVLEVQVKVRVSVAHYRSIHVSTTQNFVCLQIEATEVPRGTSTFMHC